MLLRGKCPSVAFKGERERENRHESLLKYLRFPSGTNKSGCHYFDWVCDNEWHLSGRAALVFLSHRDISRQSQYYGWNVSRPPQDMYKSLVHSWRGCLEGHGAFQLVAVVSRGRPLEV